MSMESPISDKHP